MAEDNERSGSSFGGGHRGYGHGGHGGQGGNRGGHGGYRGNGGRGFHRDGEEGSSRGGFRGNGGRDGFRGHDRDGYKPRFHRDGERSFRDRDGERREGGDRPFRKRYDHDGDRGGESRGYRGNGGFRGNGGHRDGDRDGFRRGGERGGRGGFRGQDRNGYKPRFHRDDQRDFRDRDDAQVTRDSEQGGERGERGEFHRDRRDDNRGFRRGGNPRYNGNGRFERDDRRDDRRGGYRGDDKRGQRRDGDRDDRRDSRYADRRDDRRDFKRDDRREDHGSRRDYDRNDRSRGHVDERGEFHENRRGGAHWDKARRNSDGTMSFPSQNPYTDPRPGEPKMPKGMEWSMLSKDEKERLRGLSKEHAENIGLHMLAAYSLEESDPALALEHAKWIAHQASRIDMARETLAFIAYRQGDYKLALREFRTAFRMNGYLDYLPFIADCERGTGNPKKAIEVATGDEAKQLRGEAKAEMFLVYAGALSDLGMWGKAADIAGTVARAKGLSGEYRMRAVQAEQYFLEQDGRLDDAAKLDTLLDKLEDAYAEVDEDDENAEDVVIDYDLADFSDDQLDMLGISEDEAQYAPDDEDDDESDDESDTDGDDASDEDESSDGGESDADSDDADNDDEEPEETEPEESSSDESVDEPAPDGSATDEAKAADAKGDADADSASTESESDAE